MASDGNMHFPPGQRREKPTFEPPPWERDQFEELAKQKREADEAQQLAAADSAAEGLSTEAVAEELPAAAAEPEPQAGEASEEVGAEKPELDPKHVEMLMMGLRSEEPRPDEAYWKVTIGAGVASALIGLLVTTWGLVALATPKRPGAGPMLFVTLLLVFGLGFIAGGAWVIFNSLRQRGVL
jgi:hypothetical protein